MVFTYLVKPEQYMCDIDLLASSSSTLPRLNPSPSGPTQDKKSCFYSSRVLFSKKNESFTFSYMEATSSGHGIPANPSMISSCRPCSSKKFLSCRWPHMSYFVHVFNISRDFAFVLFSFYVDIKILIINKS